MNAPRPSRWETHFSFPDLARPFGKITSYLPARSVGRITSHQPARGELMQISKLHLPQNFCHTRIDTQTDRHFPEIVKSCSGHPKTCKSNKNQKSKICTKPILSSAYIEESNNERVIWKFPLCEVEHMKI